MQMWGPTAEPGEIDDEISPLPVRVQPNSPLSVLKRGKDQREGVSSGDASEATDTAAVSGASPAEAELAVGHWQHP